MFFFDFVFLIKLVLAIIRIQCLPAAGPGKHPGRLGGHGEEGGAAQAELLRVGVRALLPAAGGRRRGPQTRRHQLQTGRDSVST